MLKDYEFNDDNKSDELQNDCVVMLKGIYLAFIILKFFRNKIQHTVCILSDNPSKKRLRILSTALNLDRIPLIGFVGTYAVKTPQVCFEWCWISSFRSCGELQQLAAR